MANLRPEHRDIEVRGSYIRHISLEATVHIIYSIANRNIKEQTRVTG